MSCPSRTLNIANNSPVSRYIEVSNRDKAYGGPGSYDLLAALLPHVGRNTAGCKEPSPSMSSVREQVRKKTVVLMCSQRQYVIL